MKKKGEPDVWLEEGEEEISSFLSHNDSKMRRESQRERRKWGEIRRKRKRNEKRKRSKWEMK